MGIFAFFQLKKLNFLVYDLSASLNSYQLKKMFSFTAGERVQHLLPLPVHVDRQHLRRLLRHPLPPHVSALPHSRPLQSDQRRLQKVKVGNRNSRNSSIVDSQQLKIVGEST